jgi:hypothetical protein
MRAYAHGDQRSSETEDKNKARIVVSG